MTSPDTGDGDGGTTYDGGGGGGGDGGYDTPTGGPIADDQAVDCHLANSGNCDLDDADPDEIAKANAEADKIRDEGICGTAKNMAMQMIKNGLGVWDNEVSQNGNVLLGDQGWKFTGYTGTDRVPVMHLWSKGGINAWTIAHEALHVVVSASNDHEAMLAGPDGRTRKFDQMAKFCSRS